ncbi:MAG: dTDP-4-dehydrorhamnose reductase [Halothiobacillus sp.]
MSSPQQILLLGKNGQVGWELQRALAPLGELIALDRHGENGLCGDLSKPDDLAQTVRQLAPHVIVNAAAYTAVDRAEQESHLARQVNADSVAVLAQEAHALGALLVHYSTDYVFDGRGSSPWREGDTTAPLSVYGQTKQAGEQAILASGCQHLIFRTSWVYAARGQNFAKTMLRLAAARECLTVVADQFGAPTGAELIADVTAHALRAVQHHPELAGLYHLAAGGETSWQAYAEFVITYARKQGKLLAVRDIAPILTRDYPTAAIRPLNSRLDTTALTTALDVNLPHWSVGVTRMLDEILETL